MATYTEHGRNKIILCKENAGRCDVRVHFCDLLSYAQQWHRYRNEDETKLRYLNFFDIETKRASLFQKFSYRRRTNRVYSIFLKIEARTKRTSSKLFQIVEERIYIVLNFLDLRKNEENYSKAFQDRRGTRGLVPNLLRSKKKRSKLFYFFQDQSKNEENQF